MDRRTVLAVILIAAVILLTPRFFPPGPAVQRPAPDTLVGSPAAPAPPAPTIGARPDSITPAPAPAGAPPPPTASAPPETVSVRDSLAQYHFSTRGGVLESVDLTHYQALPSRSGVVTLRGKGNPLLRFIGIVGGDSVRFDSATFNVVRDSTAASSAASGMPSITMAGAVGADSLFLTYQVIPDSFVVRLSARVGGRLAAGARSYVLLLLPPTLESFEADTTDDQRNLAFVVQPTGRDSRGIGFGDLDPGERSVVPGPHTWVALKNKYFIIGALTRDSVSPLLEFSAVGLPRTSRLATMAQGVAVIEPDGGHFTLDVYTGPQQWRRLRALGRDFESSNPYGGFMQPIVQPFAVIVMRILLWLRETLAISYGWVLVIFGVAVRLVLWPLNQSAMRTSLKMQRIQPELTELQKRYKSDPQKLQTEMMRVYKEHGMSPFSMFSGCLPLLIPMPVLFALFFVFQSTIEFRGVSFLWLQDISLKDPFYILPALMGASMFVLTWIGSRNSPPNPQTKVMMYVFPVMMTVLLANLAAGLNLYYAVQNVAALPQQWLIARERAKTAPVKK
ncbi:MAG TPA: YidC/Oxa1 family insertase periplasmic-domain containing protein [Gemmatimonadaceae bacterium]|nr:YidC/Oxa1 family insertase periplasmic-domain containing protein [Gemmatimonadaceae bacterium]